tara:strand:- start:288 stop:1208 length:921 start_codon:yes stop_codon:yes gene_type:complete
MKPNEFINIIKHSIDSGQIDEKLLSHEVRFFRGRYILKVMENVSRLLKLFNFQDQIIFQDGVPYIILNKVKFVLDNPLFLKHTGRKHLSQCHNTINFINHINLKPRIIIDIGACWGEYSLLLAKEFPKSKIFSIEGSPINFKSFKKNIKINSKISKIISPFNLIISDLDGEGTITNNLNTMNIANDLNKSEAGVVKVISQKLKTFISDNDLKQVDFIKIDIEGSELKLLECLLNNYFKVIQIELINYNDINDNIEFIVALSEFFNFFNTETYKKLNLEQIKELITYNLLKQPTIDIFLVNKNYKIK